MFLMVLASSACGQPQRDSGRPARDDSGAAAASDLSRGGTASPSDTETATTPSLGNATPSDDAAEIPTGSTPLAGELPQTEDKPTADSEQFRAGIGDLWKAIVEDDPERALGFFFPLSAYRQVKDIADPDRDYENRLLRQYRDDIHTWHKQLGPNPEAATFVDVAVPEDAAQWMRPGTEYNKIGYWRVLNAKLNYELDGQQRSFTIASMISWRGEWYAVHLVAIK
ncbi:MAG: hypothetical protein N2037_01845 [Acidimicrobiales bacterium]|nr:hypothetical protein [Acidimicrobiales bacterium]